MGRGHSFTENPQPPRQLSSQGQNVFGQSGSLLGGNSRQAPNAQFAISTSSFHVLILARKRTTGSTGPSQMHTHARAHEEMVSVDRRYVHNKRLSRLDRLKRIRKAATTTTTTISQRRIRQLLSDPWTETVFVSKEGREAVSISSSRFQQWLAESDQCPGHFWELSLPRVVS